MDIARKGDVKTRKADNSQLEGYRQGESLTHLTALGRLNAFPASGKYLPR